MFHSSWVFLTAQANQISQSLQQLKTIYMVIAVFVMSRGVTLPFGAPCWSFAAPNFFYCLQKKKGRNFFSGFSYRLFAPPLELFIPQIFFSHQPNAKLAEIWSILPPSWTIFRLKNSKFGNMPPPKAPPLHSGGSRGGRYATACSM